MVQEWEENRKTAGSIFMDAPVHGSIEELAQHAFDRQAWRARVYECPGIKYGFAQVAQ